MRVSITASRDMKALLPLMLRLIAR
jgi:hypothetical protein